MRLQLLERRIGDDRVEAARRGQDVLQVRARHGAVREAAGNRPSSRAARCGASSLSCQARPAGLGEDRQQAGAGRRLQHLVARPDLGGQHGQGAPARRRGELVERDLLLAAAGVGQAEVGEAGQQGRDLGRRVLQPADLRAEPAQLQHQGRLDGVIGVAPRPGALGVRAAEGRWSWRWPPACGPAAATD